MIEFDWDDANRDHLARHGISPEETEQVLLNEPFLLEVEDHPEDIRRFRHIGETNQARIFIVMSTWRGELLRVITAWDPPKAAKRWYLTRKALDDGIPT